MFYLTTKKIHSIAERYKSPIFTFKHRISTRDISYSDINGNVNTNTQNAHWDVTHAHKTVKREFADM